MNNTLEEIKSLELKLNSVDLQDTETQSEEALEAPKAIPKKKRVPSEKQLEVLRIARDKLAIKQKKIVKKKSEQEGMEQEVQRRLNEYKEDLEQKKINKTISIKKKQIKKEAVLDEISYDETPMEAIKQIAKKKNN